MGLNTNLKPNSGNYYAYNISGSSARLPLGLLPGTHPTARVSRSVTTPVTGLISRRSSIRPGMRVGLAGPSFLPDGTQIVNYSNGIQRIRDNNGNSIKIFSDANGMHYRTNRLVARFGPSTTKWWDWVRPDPDLVSHRRRRHAAHRPQTTARRSSRERSMTYRTGTEVRMTKMATWGPPASGSNCFESSDREALCAR